MGYKVGREERRRGDAVPTEKTNVPALVLEGGGFRGMFTAGVLDVLQERGLYGFSSIWGVSAGAINGSNFRARQIGRTMRDILAFRDDRRFMSLWSFAKTGRSGSRRCRPYSPAGPHSSTGLSPDVFFEVAETLERVGQRPSRASRARRARC